MRLLQLTAWFTRSDTGGPTCYHTICYGILRLLKDQRVDDKTPYLDDSDAICKMMRRSICVSDVTAPSTEEIWEKKQNMSHAVLHFGLKRRPLSLLSITLFGWCSFLETVDRRKRKNKKQHQIFEKRKTRNVTFVEMRAHQPPANRRYFEDPIKADGCQQMPRTFFGPSSERLLTWFRALPSLIPSLLSITIVVDDVIDGTLTHFSAAIIYPIFGSLNCIKIGNAAAIAKTFFIDY